MDRIHVPHRRPHAEEVGLYENSSLSCLAEDGAMRDSSSGQKKPAKVLDTSAQAEAASALAIAALRFIAEEPERLRVFLALTGIDPQAIRAAAQEPGFLLGVLDHLAGDESLLLAFARESEIDPEDVRVAHRVLAGHTTS
jgi:hypothetical protein